MFFVGNTRRLFGNFSTANFRQIWPRHVNHGWNADFGQKFMKSFHSGVICSQNPKLWGVKQVPHSEQATGQGIHCREILFIPRCSPGAREFPRSVNFFVRRTVAELRGIKVAQFSDFGLFSPYKTPKKSDQPTAQKLDHRMIPIVSCDSRKSIGVPSGSGVFIRLLVGELRTPKLAQMAISMQNASTRRVRSGPKMCENAQF